MMPLAKLVAVVVKVTQKVSKKSKDKFFKRTEEAKQRGIFGAPMFIVDGEFFWGNDRLDKAIAWLLKQ